MQFLTEEQKTNLEDLTAHVLEYLDTRWDLLVLSLTERILHVASALVTMIILAIFSGIILTFFSIGAAISISQALHSPASGFFIMGGVFIVFLILSMTIGVKRLRNSFTTTILDSIRDEDITAEEDEEEAAQRPGNRKGAETIAATSRETEGANPA